MSTLRRIVRIFCGMASYYARKLWRKFTSIWHKNYHPKHFEEPSRKKKNAGFKKSSEHYGKHYATRMGSSSDINDYNPYNIRQDFLTEDLGVNIMLSVVVVIGIVLLLMFVPYQMVFFIFGCVAVIIAIGAGIVFGISRFANYLAHRHR